MPLFSKGMKILFFTSNLNTIGGIQKYNRVLLETLSENKVAFLLVELKKNNLISKIIFVLQTLIKTFQVRPDIIICSHINYSPLGYFLKKLLDNEYIVTTHGREVWGIESRLKIRSLKKARKIITISNYTKEKLTQEIPEIKERIFLLPNSVNGDKFVVRRKPKDLIAKYNLSDSCVILTVSRLSAVIDYKGYDKVIKALPLVIKTIPKVKYFLVGDGDDCVRIQKLIKELGLEEHVVMTGYVNDDEIVDYYNLSDVFIMPSKGEGFGIVFIEALACGKPVIAGDQDGSREALLGGELGVLVNPDNIHEIAAALIQVLKKEIPQNLFDSEFLRRRVLEVYGLGRLRERVKELLIQL